MEQLLSFVCVPHRVMLLSDGQRRVLEVEHLSSRYLARLSFDNEQQWHTWLADSVAALSTISAQLVADGKDGQSARMIAHGPNAAERIPLRLSAAKTLARYETTRALAPDANSSRGDLAAALFGRRA